PVLQVYRRQLPDAGGPGRFRGGVTVEFASVPHKMPIRPGGLNTVGSGVALPAGRGLAGGAPGAASRNFVLRGSNLMDLFAAGRVPATSEELECREVDVLAAKSFTLIDEGDVLIGSIGNGSGYGDPLRRDPELVARDVREGLVSEALAAGVYGVVMRDGKVDGKATEAARSAIRAERLAEATPQDGGSGGTTTGGTVAGGTVTGGMVTGGMVMGGTVLHPVGDTVEAVEHDGERSLRCTVCGYRFGPYDHDHKRSAVMRELPLTAISPHNALCLPEIVLREFYCPGCGTAIAVDVQRSGDEILDETRLEAPAP
ncbi:MAG: hydantoinase B/oxoprolinase family protein, partial [Solirubrobacteraceae bacterium]